MSDRQAAAAASPNIAFIKYWGNRDSHLRLPASGSISMTMDGLETRTTVRFDRGLPADSLMIDGEPATAPARTRVSKHLDLLRAQAGVRDHAAVSSRSNVPAGAGLASSAAAFAALTLAACAALDLPSDPPGLSRLARRGSGSACRSVYGGFVEWLPGDGDADSLAVPLAPPEHWALVDLVALVSREHKAVTSSEGHGLADTSPLQRARLDDAPRRLAICRQAIADRDFEALAAIAELDSHLMHAVMMTSTPPLLYWAPATLTVLQAAAAWRRDGLQVFCTIDAGPNVHCLATLESARAVEERLGALPGVLDVVRCPPGGPARLIEPYGEDGAARPGML